MKQEFVIDVTKGLKQHLYNALHNEHDVHNIRVAIKKLLAWIKLVGDKQSNSDWKILEAGLKSNARCLSGKRDAQVIMETLDWLEKKTDIQEQRIAINTVYEHIKSDSPKLRVNWRELKKTFSTEEKIISELVTETITDSLIREGLRKSCKRIKKYGKVGFLKQGKSRELHALRKWIKYLYYQLENIDSAYINQYDQLCHTLDKLGDKLGKLHDLVMVRERLLSLSETGCDQCQLAITKELVDRRYKKLYRQSKDLYRKLLLNRYLIRCSFLFSD